MELFWTQITDAQPARPARTKAHGSAWGVSLLAYAVRAVWGIDLPETAELPGGFLRASRFCIDFYFFLW